MRFWSVLALVGVVLAPVAPSKAAAFLGLEELAQKATLPIVTPANGGSITIIGRKGSRYAFLTAAHVVAGTSKGEANSIDLSVHAGRELLVPAAIVKDFRPDGVDLVVGTFEYSGQADLVVLPLFGLASDNRYDQDPTRYGRVSVPCDDRSVPTIDRCIVKTPLPGGEGCLYTGVNEVAPCNRPPMVALEQRLSAGTYDRYEGIFNNKRYDVKTGTIGDFVVSGYSLPSRSVTERVLRVSLGVPKTVLSRNLDGYNLLYEATSTVPGMSGGPVVAARLCPGSNIKGGGSCSGNGCGSGAYAGIVGIHGKSEEYSDTGARSGIGLAIPITSPVVVAYLTSQAGVLGVPASGTYLDAVRHGCSDGRPMYY